MIYKYAHPEFFADWERPNFEQIQGKIVLYGAGRRGSVAAHCLKKKGIEFECFCDSDPKKQGKEYCEHMVISPDELRERYKDSTILITTNHYFTIYGQLKALGFENVYSCVSLFETIDFEGYTLYSAEYQARNIEQYFYALVPFTDKKVSYIPQILLPVTLRCTLRCKECNSYIPYCTHPEDFSYDDMVQMVNKVLMAYQSIGNILLYGGEPLLYKDLYRLVHTFVNNPQIEKVTVVTNGTLVPKEELLEELCHPKVFVRISNYGKLSTKMDELKDVLQQKGIPTEITDFKVWNRNPTVEVLDETTEQLREKVKNCCAIAKSVILINGKIFFCSYSGYYDYFKAVPDYGDNNVNLLEFKGTGEELREKIDSIFQMSEDGLPKKACRFCKFNNFEDDLPVAEQTKEVLHFKEVY